MIRKNKAKGIIFTLVAAIMFGIIPSLQNFILLKGIPPVDCTFVCTGAASLVLLIVCYISKTSLKLQKKQLIPLSLAGFCIFLTDWLLQVSYTLIPVGFTTMIHFIYPTIICITTTIFFHERFNHYKLLAILFSFTGLILISESGFDINLIGILTAFITAIAYSSFLIIADKTNLKTMPALVFSFYTNLICFFLCFLLIKNHKIDTSLLQNNWIWIILSASMLASGTFFQNKGVKLLGSSIAGFMSMIEPVTSVMISIAFFSYRLPLLSIIGSLLIVISLIPASNSDS